MDVSKCIEDFRAFRRHYLADRLNTDLLNDTPRREIETILRKERAEPCDAGLLALHAGSVGGWILRTGGLAILDGNHEKWSDFHQGLVLVALDLRGQYFQMMKHADKADRGSWSSYRGTEPLVHALVVNDQALADEMAELIIRAITHGVSSPHNYHGYEPFVMSIYQLARGEQRHNTVFNNADLGDKYQGVWKHWNSVDELSKECTKLCDIHLEIGDDEAEIGRGAAHGQFFNDEFQFYPVEILAIQRIRKKLGLPVPTCDHDLMKSPLAQAPTQPPKLTDDLPDRVRERLRREYGRK